MTRSDAVLEMKTFTRSQQLPDGENGLFSGGGNGPFSGGENGLFSGGENGSFSGGGNGAFFRVKWSIFRVKMEHFPGEN